MSLTLIINASSGIGPKITKSFSKAWEAIARGNGPGTPQAEFDLILVLILFSSSS